jgi:hypothetical protein
MELPDETPPPSSWPQIKMTAPPAPTRPPDDGSSQPHRYQNPGSGLICEEAGLAWKKARVELFCLRQDLHREGIHIPEIRASIGVDVTALFTAISLQPHFCQAVRISSNPDPVHIHLRITIFEQLPKPDLTQQRRSRRRSCRLWRECSVQLAVKEERQPGCAHRKYIESCQKPEPPMQPEQYLPQGHGLRMRKPLIKVVRCSTAAHFCIGEGEFTYAVSRLRSSAAGILPHVESDAPSQGRARIHR